MLRVASELRAALTAAEHGQTPAAARTTAANHGARTVTLTTAEARTLLRAIEPYGQTRGGRRRSSARLVAAIGAWWRAHVRLTDTAAHPALLEPAIVAALELRNAVSMWVRVLRWHQACVAAQAAWRCPHGSITAVIGQPTGLRAQRLENARRVPGQGTLLLPLPGLPTQGLPTQGLPTQGLPTQAPDEERA